MCVILLCCFLAVNETDDSACVKTAKHPKLIVFVNLRLYFIFKYFCEVVQNRVENTNQKGFDCGFKQNLSRDLKNSFHCDNLYYTFLKQKIPKMYFYLSFVCDLILFMRICFVSNQTYSQTREIFMRLKTSQIRYSSEQIGKEFCFYLPLHSLSSLASYASKLKC